VVFDGKQDTDTGFISASFGPLNKIVPSQSKIVIGEPATSSAESGLSDPDEVVSDIWHRLPVTSLLGTPWSLL